LECLGWWNLNIVFLFAGYLSVTSIAAQVIIMQIKNFTTMIPTGLSFTASSLVGNCIGMNQVQRAKQYEFITILYSIFFTSSMLLVFYLQEDSLSRLFSNDETIIKATKESLWSLYLYIFFSTIKGV
jgi:Na+-driven multidrug efflux pump